MAADERTPVLVGVGALSQRCDDPKDAPEPLEAMIRALERAAEDAGSRALLARADRIAAPRGFWDYPDPCRVAAERFGAPRAKTEVAELGILQTTLFGRAAAAIAAGEADVVLVMAAEARHRAQRAKALGVDAPATKLPPAAADSVLRPHAPILSPAEMRAGLLMPVIQYAMIENALRAAEGASIEKHRDEVARLWAGFARAGAANPDAWDRRGADAAAIADPARNPMQAFPYGKLHISQWNVDQAAGLVFCSVATAKRLGVAREKWVFPLAVADANHMVPFTERRALHRCAGFAASGRRALERAGRTLADVAHRELYSCFPVAVRLQMRELGIDDGRPVTVSGGMPFAGGPLNHFSLQALVKLAQLLRADPGSAGYLSAVSGILTKQGASVWCTEPGPHDFAFDDVSEETARATAAVAMSEGAEGEGSVATYTVLYEQGAPARTVVVCDLADGRRTLASNADPALAAIAVREELCGRAVRIAGGRAELH
ncbi:MAG: acetyl-CoA acetyltransferase [Proteobacteria bacterium]|nr:MAG: acetyl-CoA acetyltransferase [Pseudomonadota bacterium]